MHTFQPIPPELFDSSPFRMIGKEWMLITTQKEGTANTMTASWGGLGVMWGKNTAFIVVRDSRYTKELLDHSDTFSLSFLDHRKYSGALKYLGAVSGRDEDKIKNSHLTLADKDGIPYLDEASTVILCKKMCCQPITAESFTIDTLDTTWYADKNYHNLYIGEIVEIMAR